MLNRVNVQSHCYCYAQLMMKILTDAIVIEAVADTAYTLCVEYHMHL